MHRVTDESPPVKEEMKEDENEVSLSRLCLSNDGDVKVDREDGDYFPFLALPDEMISHVFSFLSIKDRLRARVNKRLDKIELKSKYFVEKLLISNSREAELGDVLCRNNSHNHQSIFFSYEKSYSSDSIRRRTRNLSIGSLWIYMRGAGEFHREVYNLAKDFNIGSLTLDLPNRTLMYEVMVDSYFINIARSCESLYLSRFGNVTADALHQVYKMMIEGSLKLRYMRIFCETEQFLPFFALIGITYQDGRFFSNRNIEAFERFLHGANWGSVYDTVIFDRNLEISVHRKIHATLGFTVFSQLSLELHESEESLDKSKNRKGIVRVKLTPE